MKKFIAIISYTDACGDPPDIEELEAKSMNDAWDKLIKSRWGDYDLRLGGLEDPRTAVKNGNWEPIRDVRVFHVLAGGDSNYFDAWYEAACTAYENKESLEQDDADRAEFERLQKKFG